MLGIYLHIPYCLRKCAYCDFASTPLDAAGGLPAARRYLDALAVEMDLRAASAEFHGMAVETVYFGGGTPTVLPPEWIAGVLERLRLRFPVAGEAEVTIEANPGTVDEAAARALLAAGVNRVSLGVQSLDDDVLQTLGRAHTADDARRAAAALRAAGCRNLSLDLIYGVPGQSLRQWGETLEAAVGLSPEHISAYALSIEPGFALHARIAEGELQPLDDDAAASMYELAMERLEAVGYEHYEISNFARPGMQCRHNRVYWTYHEYLGLGASAASFRRGLRWNNAADLGVYIEWIERGRLPVARAEALAQREQIGEMLMLGLRLAEGVAMEAVVRRCGRSPEEAFGEQLEELRGVGLLVVERGRLQVPRDRWLLSNEALARLTA